MGFGAHSYEEFSSLLIVMTDVKTGGGCNPNNLKIWSSDAAIGFRILRAVFKRK